MLTKKCLLVAGCALGLLAGQAFAQPADTTKKPATAPTAPVKAAQPATTAKPAEAPKGAQPTGDKMPPGMDEMMKKMEAAGKVGPMHARLAKNVGVWEGKTKMWMMAGGPASESTCTTTNTSMLDGRFVSSETKGMMDMGGMKMPFEGHGIYGYNNTTKKFESTWIDNMGTMMMNSTGDLSADGKTLTWTSTYTCPVQEKPVTSRIIEKTTGDNTMSMEMWGPDMMTGKDYKMMEIEYTRKSGAKTEVKPETKPATAPKTDKPAEKK